MSKNSRPAWWFALSTLVVLAPLSAVAAEVAEPRLDTYATSDGTSYFALSLAINVTVPEAGSRDVVVLFDTSASQTSVFRDKALAALSTLLVSLPRGDRVHLMAVDLDAVPLTPQFVAPQGPEMDQAVAALKARVPLGATDMPAVLTAAAASFPKKSSAAKALVYIGDGMSTANFLELKEYRALVDSLAALRVPVSSYAIGPRTDSQYLAALANQTGGMLAVDGDSVDPKQAGLFLASAVRGSVLWPTESTWPSQFAEVYPTQTPPLRTDRETIVVGKVDGTLEDDVKIAIEVENSGKRQTLDWSLAAEKPSEAFAFLPALVEMAHHDGGVRLVTVGHAGLEETRRILDENLQALVKLSSQAVITGNLDTAERLVAEALRRDPNDADALAVQKQLAKVRAGDKSAAAPEEKLQVKRSASEQAAPPARTNSVKFKRPVEAPPQPEPIDEVNDGEGRLLADIERQNKLISSLIRTEVEHELREARAQMGNNPSQAEQGLKLILERVAQSPELKAEVRAQLRGQLETALREASRRLATKEILDQQLEEARAGALDRLKIADALNRNQEKLKQLVDRFESLMDEGRYSAADELGSTEIPEVGPNQPVASSTAMMAHLVGARAANLAQRNARAKAVVDTLATVEISFIPFPDDQPVVYPDAAAWEELTQRRKKYRSVDLKKFTPAEQKIRELLNKETAIPAYSGASLQDVADDLKDRLGIEIQLDLEHLKEDLPISIDTVELPEVKGMSLRAYLSLMKKRLPGLAWLIQDDMLLLTTKEVAESEENLIRKVYPVGDLVVPIMSTGGGMGGGMGMMGGMGGGMGGMGGGMGGMGGGGMGGMGGGGMGGMGGGMFSVPDDVPASAPKTWQAFAVPDDLKLTPKKTPAKADAPAKTETSPGKATDKTQRAPAAKSAAPTGAKAAGAKPAAGKAAAKPSAIAVKVPEGADLDQVWNDYFATHQEAKSDAVRQTARQLMHERKYPELIAMIRAALRNGQPQPWMYEAMGLAMQAAGSPKGEIERALMSAVDFGDNTDDFMYVGQYMARSGLESRALKVFHQVAVVEPLRPEPYLYGLQLALRLNDLDGIRWSSLGILKQAWPRDKNHIVQSASRAAADVVAQLKAQKRTAEAADFQAELDKANVRDCLVKVTWTGDADVDILVQEPSGTICSFRTPRTTAGGVILGDAAARDTRAASSGALSETYVCPEAFDGTYRVLIRKVWGKVTAGKVTVDVYAHYGSPEQKHLRDQVTLGDQDSLVTFDLTKGRRTEPLAEQQLANAAAGQVAVNQAVLAQQLGSLPGSQSAGINLAASRRGLIGIPFIQQAVGYMPVITTIPSGARLGISGVISADRRYVRVTPQPFFTQIGQVTTFNLQQGVTGTTSGGAQGGGGVGGGNPQGGPPA